MARNRKWDRHIRWNWETSPDNFYENSSQVRYHFVIVDDKARERTLEKILNQLTKVCEGVIEIRKVSEKVPNTKFRYLFVTYDSRVSPTIFNLDAICKKVKRDFDLYERKRGSIEDYVANLYG